MKKLLSMEKYMLLILFLSQIFISHAWLKQKKSWYNISRYTNEILKNTGKIAEFPWINELTKNYGMKLESKYIIYFLFSTEGCPKCLISFVALLNPYVNENGEIIIGIHNAASGQISERIRNAFNIRFEIIENTELDQYIKKHNKKLPSLLLINRENKKIICEVLYNVDNTLLGSHISAFFNLKNSL